MGFKTNKCCCGIQEVDPYYTMRGLDIADLTFDWKDTKDQIQAATPNSVEFEIRPFGSGVLCAGWSVPYDDATEEKVLTEWSTGGSLVKQSASYPYTAVNDSPLPQTYYDETFGTYFIDRDCRYNYLHLEVSASVIYFISRDNTSGEYEVSSFDYSLRQIGQWSIPYPTTNEQIITFRHNEEDLLIVTYDHNLLGVDFIKAFDYAGVEQYGTANTDLSYYGFNVPGSIAAYLSRHNGGYEGVIVSGVEGSDRVYWALSLSDLTEVAKGPYHDTTTYGAGNNDWLYTRQDGFTPDGLQLVTRAGTLFKGYQRCIDCENLEELWTLEVVSSLFFNAPRILHADDDRYFTLVPTGTVGAGIVCRSILDGAEIWSNTFFETMNTKSLSYGFAMSDTACSRYTVFNKSDGTIKQSCTNVGFNDILEVESDRVYASSKKSRGVVP